MSGRAGAELSNEFCTIFSGHLHTVKFSLSKLLFVCLTRTIKSVLFIMVLADTEPIILFHHLEALGK